MNERNSIEIDGDRRPVAVIAFGGNALLRPQDHGTPEGVKAAFKHFQVAAGLLEECRERIAYVTDRLPPGVRPCPLYVTNDVTNDVRTSPTYTSGKHRLLVLWFSWSVLQQSMTQLI